MNSRDLAHDSPTHLATRGSRASRILPVVRHVVGRALLYLIVTAGALFFCIPFAWMLSTSVKPSYLIFVMPPVWIPNKFIWSNFVTPWFMLPWLTYYRNTLILVVNGVIATVISSAIVAYAFARLRFRGRTIMFLLVLSTMLLPMHVTLIPQYVLFARLKWVNTLKPLTVPFWFAGAFNVFLLRQFFMTIHPELDDAARIDGCGIFGIFWRIIVPLAKPALAVVAIFEYTYQWNDFFGPLIYLNSPRLFTVSLGLQAMQTRTEIQVNQTMAMTTISVIPVLVVFFLAQRYFIQGIVLTGVKG